MIEVLGRGRGQPSANRRADVGTASYDYAMYAVILAAVDGSSRARGVVDAALEMADRFDARVHLFRSVAVPQDFPAAAHMPPDHLAAFLENEARQSLTALAAGHPRAQIEAPEITPVQPWRAILGAAAKLDVDLIVIGSHGHRRWDCILALLPVIPRARTNPIG